MKRIALAAATVAAVAVGGCGFGPDKSREDAHDTTNVDKTAPHVIAFNNNYPDVEEKCDGNGHRIYVGTHKSAVGRNIIVVPDPTCPGYVKAQGLAIAP